MHFIPHVRVTLPSQSACSTSSTKERQPYHIYSSTSPVPYTRHTERSLLSSLVARIAYHPRFYTSLQRYYLRPAAGPVAL